MIARLFGLGFAATLGACADGAPPVPATPPAVGALVYAAYDCAECHVTGRAPRLEGFGGIARTAAFLRDPDAEAFFGGTRHRGAMPSTRMDRRRVERLAAWLVGGAPDDGAGARDFVKGGCGDCHTDPRPGIAAAEGHVGQTAPTLAGYGSAAWVERFLRDPASPAYFGPRGAGEGGCPPQAEMPAPWREALAQWIAAEGLGPWQDARR